MDKKETLDMNLEQTLMEDEHFKEGATEYERIMEQSMNISEEITSALIKEIVKKTDTGEKANTLTLTTAIMATAKTLINLSSYVYETEDELKDIIIKARETVVNTVIPALLNPQPCGECPECKNGQPCSNPKMDTEMLQTRTLPILCASLLEYDLWNKTMYMYTEGRELLNQDVAEDKAKEEGKENVEWENSII